MHCQALPQTVLLVEDEPTIAVTLCDDLVEQGIDVTVLGDGSEAIRLLDARRFGAVITDYRLPGADGLAVAAAAKRRAGTPVLLISAWTMPLARGGPARVADAMLVKPFDNQAVLDWLCSVA